MQPASFVVLPEDDEGCPLEITPCITETETGSYVMACHVIYILECTGAVTF